MSDPSVYVEDFSDFRRLLAAVDEVGAQGAEIASYAERWVCATAGFAPSPVCVLRPLAEAMDVLAEAFAALERGFAAQWADVRAAVVAVGADLEREDDLVRGDYLALTGDLPPAA